MYVCLITYKRILNGYDFLCILLIKYILNAFLSIYSVSHKKGYPLWAVRPRGLYMTYIPPSRYLTLTKSRTSLHI